METLNNALKPILDYLTGKTFFGNTLLNYIIAIVIFIAISVAITIVIRVVAKKLKIVSDRTSNIILTIIVELIRKRLALLAYIVGLFVGLKYLTLNAELTKIVNGIVMIYIMVIVILCIIDIMVTYNDNKANAEDPEVKTIPEGLMTVFKAIIWIFGIIIILSNLGYNVTTLITGLGIGGIAIALAAQGILGDLFSYFVILFDKPFVKGDFIKFGGLVGTVESVGIKTARIRSGTGELLSVSNTDLVKSVIHNYKVAEKRKQSVILGIEYETAPALAKQVPDILKKAVEGVEGTEVVRIFFTEFGDFSLNFELTYFVVTNSPIVEAEIVGKVNYAILDAFAANKINFAYPTHRQFQYKG